MSERICSIEDCDRPHRARGYCQKHYMRVWTNGDLLLHYATPTTHPPRQPDCSYNAAHQRLKTDRGRAAGQACQHCGSPADQWSYDHLDPDERQSDQGAFSLKPEHYRPLCYSCHTRFDHSLAKDAF